MGVKHVKIWLFCLFVLYSARDVLALTTSVQSNIVETACSAATAPIQYFAPRPNEEVPPSEIQARISKKDKVLGFSRNKEGLIQFIHSSSGSFKSRRDFGDILYILTQGWSADREIKEIPLSVGSYDFENIRLEQSADFSLLPKDLQAIVLTNNLLITNPMRDLIAVWPGQRVIRNYSILMAVNHQKDRPDMGRSGILLRNHLPIVLRIDGKEFLVEIKGVGAPDGYFKHNDQKSNLAIRGGLVHAEGNREFSNLEKDREENPRFKDGDAVRTAGVIYFETPDGQKQAYLIRLTPGSMRATYRDNPGIDPDKIDRKKIVAEMAKAWADLFARKLIPRSHPENLIASLEWDHFWPTDYSDIFRLDALDSPKVMIQTAILAIKEIPGRDKKEPGSAYYWNTTDFKIVKDSIAERLLERKKIDATTAEEMKNAKTELELSALILEKAMK